MCWSHRHHDRTGEGVRAGLMQAIQGKACQQPSHGHPQNSHPPEKSGCCHPGQKSIECTTLVSIRGPDHSHLLACIVSYIYIYIHIHVHVNKHVYIYMCMYVYINIYVYTHRCMWIDACMCVFMCLGVYVNDNESARRLQVALKSSRVYRRPCPELAILPGQQ